MYVRNKNISKKFTSAPTPNHKWWELIGADVDVNFRKRENLCFSGVNKATLYQQSESLARDGAPPTLKGGDIWLSDLLSKYCALCYICHLWGLFIKSFLNDWDFLSYITKISHFYS